MSSKTNKKLEELIQKYLNTKDGPGKRILLALIKRLDPKYKG